MSSSRSLQAQQHFEFAAALARAQESGKVISQISRTAPSSTIHDAYAIQQSWLQAKQARGFVRIGRKIGLTSRAMQIASGVEEPDYGFLTNDMFYTSGTTVPLSNFISPRVEVELVFVLRDELYGSDIMIHDVIRATEFVLPALEIIDYRTAVPRAVVDTIADNAAAAGVVLGHAVKRPEELDLRWVGATLSRNGTIETSGVSAAVLGHPAAALAWLCRNLSTHDEGLHAGEMILSGSFTSPLSIASGDFIEADFGTLGTVSIAFANSKP